MVGFEYEESLTGTYHWLSDPGDELPISVQLVIRVPSTPAFLVSRQAELSGNVTAQGLATSRAIRGSLALTVLDPKATYDFYFEGDDGKERRFHGVKEFEPVRLVETVTTLPGSITEDDEEVARALLRFKVRDELIGLIRSIRVR